MFFGDATNVYSLLLKGGFLKNECLASGRLASTKCGAFYWMISRIYELLLPDFPYSDSIMCYVPAILERISTPLNTVELMLVQSLRAGRYRFNTCIIEV